jgi:ATP synthase F1 delta subunit
MARKKPPRLLAYIYAEALYDAASEMGVLSQVQEELVAFQQALRQDPRLLLFLDSPVIRFEDKCSAMRSLAQLTQPGFNFMRVLVSRQRVELLDQIIEAFREHCNRKAGLAEVELAGARELGPDEAARLTQILERRLGRRVALRQRASPELLGGFVLTHDDCVYDASVSHHLRRLMEQIGAARSGLRFYSES